MYGSRDARLRTLDCVWLAPKETERPQIAETRAIIRASANKKN